MGCYRHKNMNFKKKIRYNILMNMCNYQDVVSLVVTNIHSPSTEKLCL